MSDPILTPAAPKVPVTPPSDEKILKVGGGTDCKKLAFAIVGVIEREKRKAILEYIGAGACSQAVKSVAIANAHLARAGKYLSVIPVFVHRELKDNNDATGLQLKVIVHQMS